MTRSAANDSMVRQAIAQLSAKIMVQQGINDFQVAKQKAAEQLGVTSNAKNLPSNSEIESELQLYQRLFKAESHPRRVQQLRQTAIQAMQLFSFFSPRLVGSVLQGTANENAEVTLHLFADSPEEIAFFLLDKQIPYQLSERRYRLANQSIVHYPCYQFYAGEEAINLVVFNTRDIRWSPPSPIDGKPMKRADIKAVEKLLQAVEAA